MAWYVGKINYSANDWFKRYHSLWFQLITWVSQKFYNVLVCASLQCVYQMTKVIKDVEGTYFGW